MGSFYAWWKKQYSIDSIEFAKKWKIVGQRTVSTSMDRDGTRAGYDIELMSKYH